MIRDDKLDFWIKNNYNVLFRGKAGVGKTAVVTQAFDRAGLKWKYFSASTLDPWVDFCGVPKEVKTPDGKSYLELVRPKDLQEDEIEAIFMDEFNRSPKKVRNAVMELIQFKSINGKKFNKLKIVWAAVNPEDDDLQTYDVEVIDPSQLDRFHVKIDIPYECNLEYFVKKYNKQLAKSAISWWNELPLEEKNKVSPRRLDYALDMFIKQGDLRDVLPASSNIGKLLSVLKSGPIAEQLEKLFKTKSAEDTRNFLVNENNYASAQKYIFSSSEKMEFFLPVLSKERLNALLVSKEKKMFDFITQNVNKIPVFKEIISDILLAGTNRKLIRRIKEIVPANERQLPKLNWDSQIQHLKSSHLRNTQQRLGAMQDIQDYMPNKMSLAESLEALSIISKILVHSNVSTIKRIKDLTKTLTIVFSNIASQTQPQLATVDDVFNTFKAQTQQIRWKLDAAGITPKLIISPVLVKTK